MADKNTIELRLTGILEDLADIEHQRWAHWQQYVHGKGMKLDDGSLLLPPDLVAQWEKQISTPYKQLTEKEKESDREQVRKYLPIIVRALSLGKLDL
ncbi:MAG: hypothetical protein AB7P23_11665 [Amphiplicatus sp.]